ncbi:hypothetical protein Tco_1539910 [Tanacetum coccineum]
MDVSGHLEGEFYPTYLTTLAGRRWLLTHGIQLALLKCLKSPKYQGTLGRAVDFGMQEGLEVGHEHGIARRSLIRLIEAIPAILAIGLALVFISPLMGFGLSEFGREGVIGLFAVDAYNPETAKACYFNAVKALKDVDFPLVSLLKSKKDAGMDEVLDSFLLDGPLACLPEAAYLQPCIEQLFDRSLLALSPVGFVIKLDRKRACPLHTLACKEYTRWVFCSCAGKPSALHPSLSDQVARFLLGPLQGLLPHDVPGGSIVASFEIGCRVPLPGDDRLRGYRLLVSNNFEVKFLEEENTIGALLPGPFLQSRYLRAEWVRMHYAFVQDEDQGKSRLLREAWKSLSSKWS